jgi:predicted neutral ceramidase superfamily lipid hydrolase
LKALKDIKDGGLETYGKDLPLPKELKEYADGLGLDPTYRGFLPCRIAHGGIDGCLSHTTNVFKNGMIDSTKIYLPLNLLLLVFNFKNISKQIFKQALKTTIRSSCFLASFMSIIWGTICISRNSFNPGDQKSGQLLATFLCGFSVLIERQDRRKQLAMYTLPKAIESFLEVRVDRQVRDRFGYLVLPLQAFMFSTSMSFLMSKFRKEKDGRERSLINSIFKFFLSDP